MKNVSTNIKEKKDDVSEDALKILESLKRKRRSSQKSTANSPHSGESNLKDVKSIKAPPKRKSKIVNKDKGF